MIYEIIQTKTFKKKAKKLLNIDKSLISNFAFVLDLLSKNPFDPRIKTHSLKGILKGSYACSLNFSLRIIFKIISKDNNSKSIILLTLGNHDDVY